MAIDGNKINLLLDFYGPLLSEKQRNVVEMYYSSDMTLTEIADELGVSKQAASDLVKRGVAELEEIDSKLNLLKKFSDAKEIISNISKLAPENNEIQKELNKLSEIL